MFEQQGPPKTKLKSSYKKTTTRFNDPYESSLATPEKIEKAPDSECIEFECIPIETTVNDLTEVIKCPEPQCPQGYEVVIDKTKQKNPYGCMEYTCEPLPQNDVVCNVTGRTFSTFDGYEFKYDICSHVLARELTNDKWSVVCKYF